MGRRDAGGSRAGCVGLGLRGDFVFGLRDAAAIGDPTPGMVQNAAAFAAKDSLALFEGPVAKRTETLLGVQDTYP